MYNMSRFQLYQQLKNFKLVAFDLDGTIWSPDMYQLWGGGSPFRPAGNSKDLLDCANNTVRMLGISSAVLHELKNDEHLVDTKVAWVSCTDEPDWAAECLDLFETQPGRQPLSTMVDSVQIYKANKQEHFRRLKKEYPEIEYSQMLFFDNEMHNIRNVAKLGVHCIYCPDGITERAWEEGLSKFVS